MLTKCEKCGGQLALAGLQSSRTDVHVTGTISLGISAVEARVCTDCGHISLYASNPAVMRFHPDLNDPKFTQKEEIPATNEEREKR